MRTLLLGATGSIGSAVLDELTRSKHSVLALARSDTAEQHLTAKGVDTVRGDLRDPRVWCGSVREVDAIIHAAATFAHDMGEVDRQVVEALVSEGMKASRRIRFIYTGGCWLYGETGNSVASEDSPFDPIPAFSWMVENGKTVLEAPCFDSIILHPAMVYDRDGGVFSRFLACARTEGRIEVWGSLETRWPLVHREDLASAYRLVLERGATGESYNVATQEGVPVGKIVDAIARRFDLQSEPLVRPVPDAVAEHGSWAAGPALDQQMSGRKISTALGWRPSRTDVLSELT